MSKIIRQLKKIEEAKLPEESAGTARRETSKKMAVTLENLKAMLSRTTAHGKHDVDAEEVNRFLKEFKRLEKELMELREEEDEVLSSIREILEGTNKPAKKPKKR